MPEKPRTLGRREKRQIRKRTKEFERLVQPKLSKDDMITRLVCQQARKLPVWEKDYFEIYCFADTVEYLQNGIPFVVVSDIKVQVTGGYCLEKLSKPLILIGSNLTPVERRALASYLYTVWSVRRSQGRGAMKEAQRRASKLMNPVVKKSIVVKIRNMRKRVVGELKRKYLEVWKNNIKNRLFNRKCQEVISGRKNRVVFTVDQREFVVQYSKRIGHIDVYMSPPIETIHYYDLGPGFVPGSELYLGSFAIKQPS